MIKKLPKEVYVKYVEESDSECFLVADELPEGLAERNEKIHIGRYELKETMTAELVVKLSGTGNLFTAK